MSALLMAHAVVQGTHPAQDDAVDGHGISWFDARQRRMQSHLEGRSVTIRILQSEYAVARIDFKHARDRQSARLRTVLPDRREVNDETYSHRRTQPGPTPNAGTSDHGSADRAARQHDPVHPQLQSAGSGVH